MAKAVALIAASALCVLALASLVQCHNEVFTVEGQVYCDTCRVLFETKVSEYIAGADVKLQCRSRVDDSVTLTMTGTTDKDGFYRLSVSGDHEDEICEVTAISSPNPDCNETVPEISTAKVGLSKNSGILSTSRYCNSIGFVKKESLSTCIKVLDDMGFVPQL
ncbi:hypothetical protein Acr_23g0007850 [Actinidia rufa]|uniref:Pollen Ole e 1 allergen and extensin family protein n=1 Tax=Actinidia rufa TaxID=165716 RepID=A0A7J0GNM5_9ERIC|nr:hypothetical protein Acr_23g0007850 [Actinidia rufa]